MAFDFFLKPLFKINFNYLPHPSDKRALKTMKIRGKNLKKNVKLLKIITIMLKISHKLAEKTGNESTSEEMNIKNANKINTIVSNQYPASFISTLKAILR